MKKFTIEEYKIDENSSFINALKKIDYNKKGFLIIVNENNQVIGTLTDGDIRRAFIQGYSLASRVNQCYHKNCTCIKTTDDFITIIDIFKNDSIKFLPIIDEERRLVNVVTKSNLHVLLLQNIQPSMDYDFINVDDQILDFEINQRPWGFYKTSVLNEFFQSKVISVFPGQSLSLQKHERREEYWIIVHGKGEVQIGTSIKPVIGGTQLFIPQGCKHRLTNLSEKENLLLVEVQMGDYFGEDDIIRYCDIYGRK